MAKLLCYGLGPARIPVGHCFHSPCSRSSRGKPQHIFVRELPPQSCRAGTGPGSYSQPQTGCDGNRNKDGQPDEFVAAAQRLQSLVRGVGSGEDELMDKLVANETPESKLQTSAILGGLVCAAAATISLLCAKDPWVSIPNPDDTFSWAAVGALAVLPLVGLRMWSWTPDASKSLPALEDMHHTQLQIVTPWFHRMSGAHVAVMMALEVLPMTLLLLPAAQGVVAALSTSISPGIVLLGPEGMDGIDAFANSHALAIRLGGLLLTAAVAGVVQGMELSLSEEEYEVVQTAVDNSDRYYRLVAMDVKARGADADRASLAFKCVAQVYLETRSDASLLAGAITFMDVLFLGALWYSAGMSMAAPAVAALAMNSVDYYYLHQACEQNNNNNGNGSGHSQI